MTKQGVVRRRGAVGEVGTAEVIAKYPSDLTEGGNATFYDACNQAKADGFVLVKRAGIEEQAWSVLQARKPNGATDEERARLCLKATEVDPFCVSAYEVAARYFAAAGKLDDAIAHLRTILALDPLYGEALFVLARLHAKRGEKALMLDHLRRAISLDGACGERAHRDAAFTPFQGDPELLAVCPAPVAPPPALADLYESLIDGSDPYAVYVRGEEMLATYPDKLAVLEPMAHALEAIRSDLDEHGDARLASYGGHSSEYFEDAQRRVEAQIGEVRATGGESTVFRDVMGWRLKRGRHA